MRYQQIFVEIIYFMDEDIVRTSGNETERVPFTTGSEGIPTFFD